MNIKPEDLIPIKTVSELVEKAKQKLNELRFRITNLRPGGVFYTLIEIPSQGLADLYQLFKEVIMQVFRSTATGDWLELKVSEFEVYRHLAGKARGMAIFGRLIAGKNIIIPAGTVIATEIDSRGNRYQYLVLYQEVMDATRMEIPVEVEAEFAGAEYNVGADQIKNIITYIEGIDYVRNDDNWLLTPGTNDEDDETLRERARQKWYQLSTGGTREAYISWAQEIAGVVVIDVDDEHPRGQGSVDVIITSMAGIPTPDLVAQVQSHIEYKKPLCANVLVIAPTPITVDWTVTLYVNKDYGELDVIENQAQEIIDIMFRYGDNSHPDIKPFSPTRGVILAQAISNLMAIKYVENVLISSPADDVSVLSRELLIKGNVDVTTVRLG